MKEIEIEILIQFEDNYQIEQFIKEECTYIGTYEQHDTYFQPKREPFIYKNEEGLKGADKWLRLRDSNGKVELGYKKFHRDSSKKSLYADELETVVQNKEIMLKILEQLDFEPICTVVKKRESWSYKNFRIDKDSVKNLGDFYEIEYTGVTNDLGNSKKLIFDLLKEKNINSYQQTDKGYVWLLWNKNKTDFLTSKIEPSTNGIDDSPLSSSEIEEFMYCYSRLRTGRMFLKGKHEDKKGFKGKKTDNLPSS